ncbi:hypothetical protein AB0I81_24290 [Nonomuraea sp. NPDC050404]|uniref:hypothetical protein n=1 Tax=Nonomuraea sp. NPDC050404 TaxID=3155783 RepID=UPI0033F23DB8
MPSFFFSRLSMWLARSLPRYGAAVNQPPSTLRLFPGHANLRRRVAGAILFALVAGAAVAAVLQYGFGSLHGTYWLTALGLALGMAALSIPFLGLESLLGMAGLGVGAPALTLGLWALAGLLLILIADRRTTRTHSPEPALAAA